MTQCRVVCQKCETELGSRPKIWRWLCLQCAQEHQQQHMCETGHATELLVTHDDPTLDELQLFIHRAAKGMP